VDAPPGWLLIFDDGKERRYAVTPALPPDSLMSWYGNLWRNVARSLVCQVASYVPAEPPAA
jgi:hypothetical protein